MKYIKLNKNLSCIYFSRSIFEFKFKLKNFKHAFRQLDLCFMLPQPAKQTYSKDTWPSRVEHTNQVTLHSVCRGFYPCFLLLSLIEEPQKLD